MIRCARLVNFRDRDREATSSWYYITVAVHPRRGGTRRASRNGISLLFAGFFYADVIDAT